MTDNRMKWLKKAVETRQEMQDEPVKPERKNPATVKPVKKKPAVKTRKDEPPAGKGGKSSDKVNFLQVSAYVRRETYADVTGQLVNDRITKQNSRDFSELVQELLTAWLKTRKRK